MPKARPAVTGIEYPPAQRTHAQKIEVISGNLVAPYARVLALGDAQADGRHAVARQPTEYLIAVAEVQVIQIRLNRDLCLEASQIQKHQVLRPIHRERAEDEGVHRRKHRRIRADAERQRDDGRSGKPRALAQPAHRHDKVLP